MSTIPLLDPADPRLEPYRCVRERDLVGRDNRFLAEGEVVLRVLVERSNLAIESVLLTESQADRLGPWLAGAGVTAPVYVVSRAVMDGVAGFPIHRGILAVGSRQSAADPDRLLARLPDLSLVVGLVGVANHDNVGGIFRNAAAFGVSAILLDETCCDPLYRKAIRVSVGATLTVPFARAGDADGLVSCLQRAGFDVAALSPAGRDTLAEASLGRRAALLFGSEGPGLPPRILDQVRSVRIPMAAGFDSLNVATTSGIALYEVRRSDGGS